MWKDNLCSVIKVFNLFELLYFKASRITKLLLLVKEKEVSDIDSLNFGRYIPLKLLGKGAMGRVYLANDPVLQRPVAVKIIAIEDQIDTQIRDTYLERFSLEARASAKLRHPSIVTVYDAGEQDGFPWIAFEYIEGESLEELLKEKKKLINLKQKRS